MKIDEEAFRQGYMSVKLAIDTSGLTLPEGFEVTNDMIDALVKSPKNMATIRAHPAFQAMAQKAVMDGFGDKVKGFFSNPMALGGTALVAGGLMLPSLLGNKKTKKPLQQPNMGAQQGMSPLQQQARDTRFAFDKPDLTA